MENHLLQYQVYTVNAYICMVLANHRFDRTPKYYLLKSIVFH
jgi:hypothetical protein